MADRQVRLADGRLLGYRQVGAPAGRPVFYFHGLPGSRLEVELFQQTALRENFRIIAPDRPGFGLSEYQPDRCLTDWPGDVAELADQLGIDRFGVLGNSGGGPYGLACARFLPERLSSVAVVCGLGPLDLPAAAREFLLWPRLAFTIARGPRRLLALFVQSAVFCIRCVPVRIFAAMAWKASPRDREVLQEQRVRRILISSFQEAVRQGPRGGIRELQILAGPWGFQPQEIPIKVDLWYGEKDRTVPASIGRNLAAALPESNLTLLPGEGHFSVPLGHMEEILRRAGER